jgi:hypothetical protein
MEAANLDARHQREYNLFGPWLLEVTEEDDLPDCFRGQVRLDDSLKVAFKIPVHLERRLVRPGMDLYTDVLVCDGTGITVYRLAGETIVVERMPWRTLRAISVLTDLLQGELTIIGETGEIVVAFNTVSEELVRKVVETIHREIAAGLRSELPQGVTPGSVPLSHLDRTLLMQERTQTSGAVVLIAYQERMPLVQRTPSLWIRLLDVIRTPTLRPVMVLARSDGLVVYSGSPQIAQFRKGNYGYRRTVIPWGSVGSCTEAESPQWRDCRDMRLTVGVGTVLMSVSAGFPVATVRELVAGTN